MLCQLLLLFLLAAVAAADWPQWRGPQRDGQIANFSAPAAWPDSLQLQWRTPVGRGDASPVVSGDRVFVHTRRDEEEYVSALDLAEGRLLWQDSYGDVPYQWASYHADERGKGPFATPALADGVLYTYGVTQVLSAYEAASGQLLWRHRLNQSLPFGTSASPIIVDGRVIVHLGDGKVGPLTAFDGRTGKTVWTWDADGPSYSSPIIGTWDGTRQLVLLTFQYCIGLNPATGELLWQIPFSHPWEENIPTPLRSGDNLILTAMERGTLAVRPTRTDSGWVAEIVWHNPDLWMYTNSPVLHGDLLYAFSTQRKGQFFCLDAHTGKTLWATEGRQGDYISLLSAAEVLFGLSNDATLSIIEPSATTWKTLAQYQVADSPTWAHPVVLSDRLLIKDATDLSLWTLPMGP